MVNFSVRWKGVWFKHHRFFQNTIWAVFRHCLCAIVSSSLSFCLSFCLFPIFCSICSQMCMESAFGHVCTNTGRMYANTQIQTQPQRHSDPILFCPKTYGKWKSNKYSICDLHSRSRRERWKDVVVLIANTLLRRVEFGIWLSNTTDKFEINLIWFQIFLWGLAQTPQILVKFHRFWADDLGGEWCYVRKIHS